LRISRERQVSGFAALRQTNQCRTPLSPR
jgi:hypothetical protein